MTMEDWAGKLNAFLQFNDREYFGDIMHFMGKEKPSGVRATHLTKSLKFAKCEMCSTDTVVTLAVPNSA